MTRLSLPDPIDRPTISVEEAGQLLGLGRAKAYLECTRFERTDGREGLVHLRFGRTLRVPTARLLEMLGPEVPARAEHPGRTGLDSKTRNGPAASTDPTDTAADLANEPDRCDQPYPRAVR